MYSYDQFNLQRIFQVKLVIRVDAFFIQDKYNTSILMMHIFNAEPLKIYLKIYKIYII